jgi:hypothetical protein
MMVSVRLGSSCALTIGTREEMIDRITSMDRPDYPYGLAQVAIVDQDQPGASSSQRPRFEGQQQPWPQKQWGNKNASFQKKAWLKYTVEMMLDKPCCFHTF